LSPRYHTPETTARPPGRRIQFRPRVWITLVCLFALGFGARSLWRSQAPGIAQNPQYRLAIDDIHITIPPPWIRTDIKAEVLRGAGLDGNLSVLDDWAAFSGRIQSAFELHPWVASVERITRRLPSAITIELKYRKPVAAVESRDASGVAFLPVDEHAVRLPEGDLTEVERRYLPRIAGVTGRPLVGDSWADARVIGGAQLAAALADIWQPLRLVEILAHVESSSPDGDATCSFTIVTSGGTRIVWGTAPGKEALAQESPVDEKRKRLLEYASKHDHLGSINGPAELDVRTDLVIKPRTARRPSVDGAGATK
jgi:hypothetical protein